MDDHLLGWLKTLDEERLARVLANRLDALAPPWPRRLDTLAQRLGNGFAVMEVMRGLPLPSLEVAQASLALGDQVRPEEVARFMGVPEAEVTPWFDLLFDHALAWPDDEGRIRVAGGVARWWTAPCGLGEPLTHYLNSWTVSADALRGLARTLGLQQGPKRRTITKVSEVLSDPERVGALVERAPEGTRRLLEEFAWDGPVRTVDGGRFVVPGAPEKWAVDHGLIFRPSWNVAEMPREVSLALRGPDYHPPFTPGPPDLGTVPVDPEAVDHLMTLAAPHVVERCAAMLENTAKIPLPLLKAGGVGVREVRRVAKDTGCDEDETRLLLEICAVARLLAWDDAAGGLVPTEKFDRWRLDDAAARLRVLLSAWWRMERSSLRRTDGKYGTVLGDDPAGAAVARARRAVLAVLARLPANTACTDRAGLVGATHWHAPLLDQSLLAECAPAVLDEARMLGLVALDTITDLGRALAGLDTAAGDETDDSTPIVENDPLLVECSTRALASVRRSALFGADLTAVVTGPPSSELAELLDRAAERESRGAASVWRFTPASVRRAMDAGHTADGLLADLAEVGAVPQPLDYLVHDVARRHGEVSVTTVACIVQASDPVLLAEIAGHRRLSRLGLRLLAPTVLASTMPADKTLAALRENGYAPVPIEDTGEITIRRARIEEPQNGRLILLPGGRVAELEQSSHLLVEPPPDPREHAGRLLASKDNAAQQNGRTWAVIGRLAFRLPTAQQSLLGFVVDRGVRAAITLTDGLTATISHGELRGGVLDAWCEEAGDYLEFPLADIVEVRSTYA
ncbi:Helicase conserved C-terminal domain-containing protein [Streptosporangium subroseum]|uniref:Helicase conserved C-terminal domain-containing protein n=1 Tax=Streptosporangium subroseum TaxID=106412 RepID=A0A239A7G7_9ACTN|nr:helicase-associated domain-containing protein [Streptosporangium subroseum]SNR91616.1 Helicase conserved C-terminal domain-containing protein [Streptosporangium subroseum]